MHNIIKIASYPFIGLYFIIYIFTKLIFNFSKYVLKGIEYIVYIFIELLKYTLFGLLYICIFVKNIFKYAFYAVKLPFIALFKNKKKELITSKENDKEIPITKNDNVITFDENPISSDESTKEELDNINNEADNFLLDFIKSKNEAYYKIKEANKEELNKKKEAEGCEKVSKGLNWRFIWFLSGLTSTNSITSKTDSKRLRDIQRAVPLG